MKYGRKALDKIMTPGYKRVGLLRKGLVYSLVVNRNKRRNPPCAAPPLSSFPIGKNSTPRKEAHRKVDLFSWVCLYILRQKVPIQIFAFDFTNRTREPTSNFISSYRYHQRHLKPIWEHFDLRKTQHCGSHWLLKLSFLLALQ